MPVIELDNLEIKLGSRTILNRLNGDLSGRCIGLLGPNGSGKSTTHQHTAWLLSS